MNLFTHALATIFLILSPALGTVSSLVSHQESVESTQTIGASEVQRVRLSYEKGEFDSFLEEMEESYQMVLHEGRLEELLDMRSNGLTSQEIREWNQRALQIKLERNELLRLAVEGEADTIFSQKVRSAAREFPQEHELALSRLNMIQQQDPKQVTHPDEQQIVALDLEFEYKMLHLDRPVADPVLSRQDKQMVLRMEKMKRLELLSQNLTNPSLQQDIEILSEHLDERLAQFADEKDLNSLLKSSSFPKDSAGKQVSLILERYQDQFNQLARGYLDEVSSKKPS